jgi:hypothetical protein
MDFSLSALGCSLPFVVSTKRRLALHENARQQSPVPDTTPRMNKTSLTTTHRDSFLVYLEHAYQPFVGQRKSIYQDDDTVTTASTSTAESEVEKVVTFSEPLITSIYTRPVTTREDKYYLHYSEYDYVDFKIEYMTGRQRNRKVSFAQEIEVHQVQPVAAEKNILFYSEIELQEYVRNIPSRL